MSKSGMMVAAAVVLLGIVQSGCAPVAVGVGIGAAAVTAADRRSTGNQVNDETIEFNASEMISKRFGDAVHVNVTSYNRTVLLTGEVPDAQTRDEAGRIAAGTREVRAVVNELQVAGTSSLGARTNDAYLTSVVKARFLDSADFNALHVKVVTEASVVYLLGIVTEKEAESAVRIARTTDGVRKVVKVFEYCTTRDSVCAPQSAPQGVLRVAPAA